LKGVTDTKLLETPWLGLQGRLHCIRWQILLVERFDSGHANSTHGVTFRRLGRGIQVHIDPVSFDDSESIVTIMNADV
jgi:hypothetical protein